MTWVGDADRRRASARLREIALLVAVVALLVGLASRAAPLRLFDLRIFDYLSTAAPPPRTEWTPIIVAIDEPSFAEIGRQWPWPRSLHAQLVEALRRAGARAIGLDIIFAEPSDPDADAALAAALGADVVLAADETLIRAPQADQYLRVDPIPAFTDRGAVPGLVSVLIDGDGTLRRVPAYSDGFAARLLERAGVGVDSPAGSLLQAFGPARTYQTVSYYQALDPAGFLPEGIFRDRIVIVGMSMQSAAGIDQGGPDNFATSYTPRSRRLLPGAEVQATVVDNLAGRLAIAPAGPAAGFAAIVIAALCAGLTVRRRTGWATAAVAVAAVLASVLASFLLLRTGRVFLAPTGPALAFLLVSGVQSARDFSAERMRRRQITRAFSQYLSPVLVSRLAGDPAQLKLGGERRTLTVLFMDVRGFTTISEEMKDDPEGLTRLMNRLFNPLSDEILKTGGTIDKYIGDAIMAFWNAPVEDPDHAVHAIQAARAMLKAVDALNAERAREVLPGAKATPLKIGIGINTGDCVVGNIGSDFRFNYSALGDPVNLASRLESETKGRHLDILVGEETARRVGARLPLVPVGRIRVKGKSEAVSVFTPVDAQDRASLEAHRALIEAVEAREVRPDDPRFATLAQALPQLAGFYAACAAALRLSG